MNNKILIAFASKYGATAEIAQKIGDGLISAGFEVDVLPADKVKDVTGYQSVVLGVALYMGQWRKEAVQFLKNNSKTLSDRPVYVFASGPTGEGDPVEQLKGRIFPDNLKSMIETIQPKEITVFGGNVDAAKLNAFEKWIMNKVNAPSGDFRNWPAISAWTAKVAEPLRINA